MTIESRRLRHLGSIQASNVDKKSAEGDVPVRLCNYVDVYRNDLITDDLPFMSATATHGQVASFELRAGDVLLTKDSERPDDIGVPAYVPEDMPGTVCGYHLSVVRTNHTFLYPKFLFWFLKSQPAHHHFTVSAQGITRFALGYGELGDTPIPVPAIEEQRAIVRYLDEETSKIDALIKRKRYLLDGLGKWRRSLSAEVFSKYEVASWLPLRRFVISIEQGISPVCDDRRRVGDEWAVLKLSAVSKGSFVASEHKVLPAEADPTERYEVRSGDLLVTRSNTPELVGDVCVVEDSPHRLLLCDLIYRVSLADRVNPRWASLFLSSPYGRAAFKAIARGSSRSMVKIRASDIRDVRLPVPPLEDQRQIVAVVAEQTDQQTSLRAAIGTQNQLLAEYRSALITAAVTGQIDVGSAA